MVSQASQKLNCTKATTRPWKQKFKDVIRKISRNHKVTNSRLRNLLSKNLIKKKYHSKDLIYEGLSNIKLATLLGS